MEITSLQRDKEYKSRLHNSRRNEMEDNFAMKLTQMRDDHTRKVKADDQKFKELLQGKEDFAMLKTQEMEEAEN